MEGAWERPHTYDFDGTLRFLRLGSNDPSFIRRPGEVFTALFTPDGPAVLRLVDGSRLTAQAWGPGAERAVEAAPNWLGLNDTPVTLGHLHPAVRELERRHPGLHLTRPGRVFDGLLRIIPQQLVAWNDAAVFWRRLVQQFGTELPGPVPLMLSPSPDAVRAQSAAALQSTGMLPKMARCMIDCARRAKRLDALADKSLDEFVRLVQVLPGVGPWTAGQLAGFHLAHPDAVCMGDYGLPHSIAYVLTGRERSNDAEMLELLEPFRPHRFRIVRLIMHAGIVPPRRGPRGDLKTRR
ncbi:MAG: 3-methyladenine DNA glycosylase/8-oxoguanine DNA glycosylase [Myxococcota bacterium]|jgi:3-methyladenine DNA glycosylase/8-oxoguanine DNA glycosylase